MNRASTRPLVLVNSGAYTPQELAAEFGALPPSFLPVGLRRLYEYQAEVLAPLGGELWLTLPKSFEVPAWDQARLRELGFTVLQTPDELTVGEALLYTLGRAGMSDRPLRILHGDTLVTGVDLHRDNAVCLAEGGDGYSWGQATLDPEGFVAEVTDPDRSMSPPQGLRVCGYFAFASAARFAESLALARGDLFLALTLHASDAFLEAMTPERWLDFGRVKTFFRSRRIVSTSRAFNSLELGPVQVRKRSATAPAKLKAEARWLREAPPAVAPFCARLLNEGEDGEGYFYDTEYEYMPTLAELYVFGRLDPASWSRILSACSCFINAAVGAAEPAAGEGMLRRLVAEKTTERLEAFARSADIDLDADNKLNGAPAPSLRRCLDSVCARLSDVGDAPAVMHGDFCFSNILYNFRTDRIRLIDPRALTERGEFSLFGDVRYDLAKFMHSVTGRYDLIIAGHFCGGRTGANAFELEFPDDAGRQRLERAARGISMGGVRLDSEVVTATMASLFLSMAPLHADRPDRQAAFIANALRIQSQLEGGRP